MKNIIIKPVKEKKTHNKLRYLLLLLINIIPCYLYSMVSIEEYSPYNPEYLNKDIITVKNLVAEKIVEQLINFKQEDQEITIQQTNDKITYSDNDITTNNIFKNYSETSIWHQSDTLQNLDSKDTSFDVSNYETNNIKENCLIEIATQEAGTSQSSSNLVDIEENNLNESDTQKSSLAYNDQDNKTELAVTRITIENQDNNYNTTTIINNSASIESSSVQINGVDSYKPKHPEIDFLFANESQLIKSLQKDTTEEMNLFTLLNNEIHNKNIHDINQNHQLIKFIACILAIFNGVSVFAIGNNDKININIVLSTQYLTPVYVNNMYYIINNASHKSKKGYKHIITNMLENKIKTLETFIKTCISFYLAYLASVTEIKLSGDGYIWILSQFSSNEKHLSIAYNVGYFNKLILYIALNGSLYYSLIDELMYKTGVGYLLGLYISPTKNIDILIRKKHIKRLLSKINTKDLEDSSRILSAYLKDYNLNDAVNIAEMQNIIINNYKDNKKHNLFLNASSILFIGVSSAFCGWAFKQVFSAKIILKNFILLAGKKINGTIQFTSKNNEKIICKSIEDCIKEIDFTNIYISKEAQKYITSLEQEATTANILGGIAFSSSAVITSMYLFQFISRTSKNDLLKNAIKNIYFRKENIIPYLFCLSILPSLYFYNEYLTLAQPTVEKNNLLLENAGKKTILLAREAIIISMLFINIIASKHLVILADIPRYTRYLFASAKDFYKKHRS